MKATPFSTEHYYPMCMASGRDAVLVNYGGSNFLSTNGHTHFETHQGLVCGWYKSAHKTPKSIPIHPIVMAGIQVYLHGAPAEPIFYEQEFLPEEAVLRTILTFRYGLKICVSSFFTYNYGIWCERTEVLEAADTPDFSFGFRVAEPNPPCSIGGYKERVSDKIDVSNDGVITLSYENIVFSGRGRFVADRPFDSVERSVSYPAYAEGKYHKMHVGDIYTRTMILLGDNETHVDFETLCAMADRGYDTLYSEHKALWGEYFATSSVSVEDQKLAHIYNFSRYMAKSYQHPDSGIVTLGMQPNHWGGAIACSWDEEFMHQAMLATGNFAESHHFTEQYMRQADIGYEAMRRCGYPGIGFTGWTTLSGEFCGARSIDEWITDFKPMFSAYAIHSIYSEWRMNPNFDAGAYRTIAEDVLKFWLHRMIFKGEDGLYYLRTVKDGSESGVDAEVDSFTQLIFAKAFLCVAQMYSVPEYREIGEKMLLALNHNRLPDGRLSSFKGSPYELDMVLHYYFAHADGIITPEDFERQVEASRTPFGIDNWHSCEEYRHWPWNDMWAARGHMINGRADLASANIAHMTYGASSLGALPEKIRLDGYPIGYYYTSPHGLLVTTVAEGFALSKREGELSLCYGFTGDCGSASCRGIIAAGGLSVTLEIRNATLVSLEIENISDEDKEFSVKLNPLIVCDNLPDVLLLKPAEVYKM